MTQASFSQGALPGAATSQPSRSSPLPLAGRIVGGLVALVLVADGLTGLLSPQTLAAPMAETGFPAAMLPVVAIAALASAILYIVPRTAFLGAILISGFAGGAIATHLRIGELWSPPQLVCILLGVGAWAGLWLGDPRLRALLPFRA